MDAMSPMFNPAQRQPGFPTAALEATARGQDSADPAGRPRTEPRMPFCEYFAPPPGRSDPIVVKPSARATVAETGLERSPQPQRIDPPAEPVQAEPVPGPAGVIGAVAERLLDGAPPALPQLPAAWAPENAQVADQLGALYGMIKKLL